MSFHTLLQIQKIGKAKKSDCSRLHTHVVSSHSPVAFQDKEDAHAL